MSSSKFPLQFTGNYKSIIQFILVQLPLLYVEFNFAIIEGLMTVNLMTLKITL